MRNGTVKSTEFGVDDAPTNNQTSSEKEMAEVKKFKETLESSNIKVVDEEESDIDATYNKLFIAAKAGNVEKVMEELSSGNFRFGENGREWKDLDANERAFVIAAVMVTA